MNLTGMVNMPPNNMKQNRKSPLTPLFKVGGEAEGDLRCCFTLNLAVGLGFVMHGVHGAPTHGTAVHVVLSALKEGAIHRAGLVHDRAGRYLRLAPLQFRNDLRGR